MEDEDGTCLLDVLCDPQALNDFLHGTKELLSGDLLINSSSGEPSLFTDTPSPVSLLADDAGSHDTPTSGCVDLSFLDEALLASPAGGEDSEEPHDASEVQAEVPQQQEENEEEEETCDILQQSLQEADITEHTLALEAGLAQPGEPLSLYPASLPLPSPTYLSKSLNISGVTALPRDTQVAVDPPQPSLLAVGPGCPSLKPAAPQLMGLLPGNVFPAPSPETSFSLSPAQGSSMIIRKTLPSLAGRQLMTPAVRTTAAPEIILQRAPLPIQPKLPVNIQPRLVQISPKPSGQKTSAGLTFIPPAASQNILLSTPVASKQPPSSHPSAPTLNKPVSLQLVNQGGSIVIQPQGLFQGQSHFLLPSQSSVTVAQSTSTARPLLTTVSNQMPSGAPPAGHLVDGSQIVTVRPRHLNFSPVFTTPTGQLTLRQGALLSGPLQLQSAPPTVFQMPAQLTGAYTPHQQGQHGAVVHSPALGNQITLINSPSVLTPDMTSISIVNGPSVVQSLPFVSQAQRVMAGGPEEQLSLPQTPVLLLPERPGTDKTETNEQLQSILQSRLSSPASVQPPIAEMHSQPSPVVSLLQAPPESAHNPEPLASLPKHLITQPENQQTAEEDHSPQNQAFIHHLQQQALKPSASAESLSETLLVDSHISPAASETEASPIALAVCGQSDALSVLSECGGMPTPAHSGSEHSDMLSSPPILQCAGSTPSTMFPTPPLSDRQPVASSTFMALSTNPQGQEESVPCLSPSAPEKMCVSEQQPVSNPASTDISRAQQHVKQSNLRAPGVVAESELVSPDLQESHKVVSSQGTQMKTNIQVKIPVPSVSVEGKESLTLAMRQHRIKQQLCLDHNAILNPNTRSRFTSLEDALRQLLPYHTCSRALPNQADLMTVDKQFENVSGLLLKRTSDMLNKYRKLLLAESQQESPSAEMVMLERLFLQSERFSLGEERRRARGDPESFLMSLRKASLHHSMVPSGRADASSSPPSPPAWALHSDRPPGLKTYRSRSRGALRLTIKHESGSRKVIHNSACDNPHGPLGHKRTSAGQLTNGGGDTQEKPEALKPPSLSPPESSSQPVQQAVGRCHTDTETSRTACDLQELPHSTDNSECTAASPESLLPELCPPELKRTKLDSSDTLCPGSSPLVEDSGLSEHLQSAIDSILELQRLQGPAAGVKPKLQQSHSLEQAVSCMLEGEL
ncbi:BRD4-interacting chromatin-remodeling complex-associated protein isoform X2 [Salminus brasiliensis]|uniref:BRD4-interacting chromatin-remodeling complex-associated protein isoform X2 n=1 Tax=Salminus brasiliensis TaxID=930266 RepID=UPI003B8370A3